MRWWRRFDAQKPSDFALLRATGFDSVRIFLLWEDFQPTPDTVSSNAISNFVRVADIARQNELQIMPTLFTGHMSGLTGSPAGHSKTTRIAHRVFGLFRVIMSPGGDCETGTATLKYVWHRPGSRSRLCRGRPSALWAYDFEMRTQTA
jgi:hypothetical protein